MDTTPLTFTVAAIQGPQGKKPAILNTTDGRQITVWPTEFPHFQQGGTYTATCYNKPYNNQDQWTVSALSKGGSIVRAAGGPPPNLPPQNQPPPVGNPYPPSHNQPMNCDIPPILSNLLAHAIQAGKIDTPDQLSEWAKAVKMAVQVYHNPAGNPY